MREAERAHGERARAKVLPRHTVGSWLVAWLTLRESARYRNVKSERVLIRTHVAPDALARMPLASVDAPAVRAWWSRMVGKSGPVGSGGEPPRATVRFPDTREQALAH